MSDKKIDNGFDPKRLRVFYPAFGTLIAFIVGAVSFEVGL